MRVNLITGLSGFPFGTANAKRIGLIGKAILASGNEFRVYTNGIQYNEFNTNSSGIYQEISYEYLHRKVLKTNLSKPLKIICFLSGCLRLFYIFTKFDRGNDIVYSYNHGNLFNVYIISLCRLFKIKLVQEINEWYHNDLNRKLEKKIIEGPLVSKSDGAVVISDTIYKKVNQINPEIKLLKVPVLEDFSDAAINHIENNESGFNCFWMGDVDGYINDVLFIINACARVFKEGVPVSVHISGPFNNNSFERIQNFALQNNYPAENLKLLGYLSEEELHFYCSKAYFCVVPLWDDERSKSRFPTKIATFMQLAKPVFSCKIGEVSNLLTESENIIYYTEGDAADLATKITVLVKDKDFYNRISKKAFEFAAKKFNYLSYSDDFKMFLSSL